FDSAAVISLADMRVGAPGMATGAGAVLAPENCAPSIACGTGAIGAPSAPVSGGGEGGTELAAGVATRVSCDAQAASSARAGSSRSFDGTGMNGHLRARSGKVYPNNTPCSRAVPAPRAAAAPQFRLRLLVRGM